MLPEQSFNRRPQGPSFAPQTLSEATYCLELEHKWRREFHNKKLPSGPHRQNVMNINSLIEPHEYLENNTLRFPVKIVGPGPREQWEEVRVLPIGETTQRKIHHNHALEERTSQLQVARDKKVHFYNDGDLTLGKKSAISFDCKGNRWRISGELRELIDPLLEWSNLIQVLSRYFVSLSFLQPNHVSKAQSTLQVEPLNRSENVAFMSVLVQEALSPQNWFNSWIDARDTFDRYFGKETRLQVERLLGIFSRGVDEREDSCLLGLNKSLSVAAALYVDYEGLPLFYRDDIVDPLSHLTFRLINLQDQFVPNSEVNSFHFTLAPHYEMQESAEPIVSVLPNIHKSEHGSYLEVSVRLNDAARNQDPETVAQLICHIAVEDGILRRSSGPLAALKTP